jgi:hypothetical protein
MTRPSRLPLLATTLIVLAAVGGTTSTHETAQPRLDSGVPHDGAGAGPAMPSNGNGPDTGSTQGTPPDANAPDGYVADSANGADPDGSATTSGDAGAMTPGCQTGQALRASTPSSEEFNGPYASWMSVKTFGAAGDGQTDDTAAIQQALDALKNVSTNTWSTLYFPPGTYLISSELTTTRSGSNDYQGSDIVGDDPTTTTIKWTGAAGGTMFYLDAWYNKVGRLTFDGGGMAGTGLLRGPSFATYGELSDLQFQNITGTCLLLGTDTTQGIAEQSILRDRFYGCQYGVGTWNYNSLDVYVWNSYFQGNSQAIRNATGAFHAYQNVFVGSTSSDLASYTNMQSAIVGNVSVGSAAFLANFGASAVLQGNFIYATATNSFTSRRRKPPSSTTSSSCRAASAPPRCKATLSWPATSSSGRTPGRSSPRPRSTTTAWVRTRSTGIR